MASTPSNPACFEAWNLSITEPFRPIVAYMMPFGMCRLELAVSACAKRRGAATAAPAAKMLLCLRNVRRFNEADVSALIHLTHYRGTGSTEITELNHFSLCLCGLIITQVYSDPARRSAARAGSCSNPSFPERAAP